MLQPGALDGVSNDERFKSETLMELYNRAKSTDTNVLLRVAEEMFPGCTNVTGRLPVRVHERPGWRRIMREDGKMEVPAYAIGGYRLEEIFIMNDGTAYLG